MGDIGVEEDHVAGISLKQHILILWLVRAIVLAEGLPFLAHEGLFVVAGIHEAERAVVQTVLVLHDLHCDVKFSVGIPAGSLVLVQFVRSVTGKLVIDLLLEKTGGSPRSWVRYSLVLSEIGTRRRLINFGF